MLEGSWNRNWPRFKHGTVIFVYINKDIYEENRDSEQHQKPHDTTIAI